MPSHLASPIQHLVTNLLNSIERVAPEKAHVLCEQIRDNNITFVIEPSSIDIAFFASYATSTITLGLRSLELLWARSYAYCSLHDYLASKVIAGENIEDVDLTAPAIKPAMDLLSWALTTELQIRDGSINDFDWPTDLPRPSASANRSTFENSADELLLVAAAAILHHEIGHIIRGHDALTLEFDINGDPMPSSQETFLRWEREADAWSAEWLLSGLDIDDDRFMKRILGMSLAYMWIATRNIHTGHWRTYHPPAWDRIYNNIKQFVTDTPCHTIWTFIGYIIQLHLMSANIQPEILDAETPEDWVNKLLDYISRL